MLKLLLAVPLLVTPVHSWYPRECCSANFDCSPIDASRVVTNHQGYLIDGRYSIPYSGSRLSPDMQFHLCIIGGRVYCFFAPGGST